LTSPRRWAPGACLYILALLSLAVPAICPRIALAEKVIAKGDNWEVYTEGRVGSFFSWVHGDGGPVARPAITLPDGTTASEVIDGGGWTATTEKQSSLDQGTVNMMRVRSGFLANQLSLGVRSQVTPWTTITGYIQIWAFVESEARTKGNLNPADVRQGYAKLEGLWGTFIAGRTRTLFSRGATDINVLYAHKWGVGFPAAVDSKGPTSGMVGFGVLGSGFAAGMIYGTPVLRGFQLNVGIFDPAQLAGGGWFRTKYARPEAELTFERKFGETGKVVLFANGAYQKVYKDGYCGSPPCEETATGVGYGGRFELGPVHLGGAGHYGKGLGLNYALEGSYAALDPEANLRMFDGYYAQAQVVLRKFDVFAGWGIARVFLTDLDKNHPEISVIKSQMGINGGIVYNATPNVHFDLEYFRAEAQWWLGEKQILNCGSFGAVFNW
jgi:hypothetical protein